MTDIIGTDGADTLRGTPESERIEGRGGDDTLYAEGGRDTLDGGEGADVLHLSGGYHTGLPDGVAAFGGAGDDTFYLGAIGSAFVIDGGEGNDLLYTASSSYALRPILADDPSVAGFELLTYAPDGSSVVAVVTGIEQVRDGLRFGDGDDRDFDVRLAEAGGSSLLGTGERGLFAVGGAGDDTIESTFASRAADGLFGGAGDDLLITAGGGRLSGGAGADTLVGALGRTTYAADALSDLDGDRITVFGGRDAVKIAADRPLLFFGASLVGEDTVLRIGDGTGGAISLMIEGDRTSDAFRLVQDDAGARLLLATPVEATGTAGADTLQGLAGDDALSGGAGDDRLEGYEGADLLDGGAGDDRIIAGADADADTLLGGLGNDTVYSQGGADVIDLGDGNDLMVLSVLTANVTAQGGDGYDHLEMAVSDEQTLPEFRLADGVITAFGDASSSGQPIGTLQGFEALHLWTYNAAPIRIGGDGTGLRVTITTRDFDEVGTVIDLSALTGTGADISTTGTGDRIFGGAGDDVWFDYSSWTDGASLDADTVSGGAGDDTMSAYVGDDVLNGGEGADRLLGGYGNDLLIGGAGADEIYGGPGADIIYGDGGP